MGEHGDLEEAIADMVEALENSKNALLEEDPEANFETHYILFTERNGKMRTYTPKRLKFIIRKKMMKVAELESTLGELDAVRAKVGPDLRSQIETRGAELRQLRADIKSMDASLRT